MKYVKMMGLLAVAAAALMAFVGTASATTITSPTGSPYTGNIHAESHSPKTILHGEALTVECEESTVGGSIATHGASVTASGGISTLDFNKCNYEVTVLNKGSLEAHTTKPGHASLTSTGAEITIHGPFGINCLYKTSNTPLGTLTDSHTTGGHATFDIDSALIPRTGHSAFCGSFGEWTGSYTVTNPTRLYVD